MRILLFAAFAATAFAQQTPTAIPPAPAAPASKAAPAPPSAAAAMTPSDAYTYAMQPFVSARSAPNDLTDADRWALGLGVIRARQQCELETKQSIQGEDLLAAAKLCILGQDFEPARTALLAYLSLPAPKSPEVARLLSARAFIGLQQIPPAESQMESLLSLFPYDASIHLGIDMVVDAAEASDAAMDLAVVDRLDEQQLPHILDALAHGGSLGGNGDAVDAAMLVRDALRCADALRRRYQFDAAQKILTQVQTLVTAPAIAGGPYAPAIQDALLRYSLYGQPSPVRMMHGAELPFAAGAPVARSIPLYDPDPAAHRTVTHSGKNTIIRMSDDRTLVLVFSLAGPSSAGAISQLVTDLGNHHILPGLKVVAVTSYAANAGDDTPNPQVLQTLRAFRTTLPAKLPVLIVPDAELRPFAIDLWPAALLVDGAGRILWLNTLSGSAGSLRQFEREMESLPAFPPGS